ncbi:preprotein translocase subunit SecE [candidate division Kazan bacterium RBG_13_50_9]|uniref:Protein translocase subunit SecE n=1 Tax=candidate division Kazan bacterium RBG_13_50_9 TaxID=1798535 RepID=A0A1F4NUF9_UNCK3|nr:MAG: preprotein translocase subunit SecE [candidate division Kazan bacterium RBG_13_50_9]
MNKITQFIKEAIVELGKVSWPSRMVVLRLTLGVIIISALFAIFVGIVDVGLTNGLRGLLVWVEEQKAPVGSTQPIQVQPGDIQVETGQ